MAEGDQLSFLFLLHQWTYDTCTHFLKIEKHLCIMLYQGELFGIYRGAVQGVKWLLKARVIG